MYPWWNWWKGFVFCEQPTSAHDNKKSRFWTNNMFKEKVRFPAQVEWRGNTSDICSSSSLINDKRVIESTSGCKETSPLTFPSPQRSLASIPQCHIRRPLSQKATITLETQMQAKLAGVQWRRCCHFPLINGLLSSTFASCNHGLLGKARGFHTQKSYLFN